MINETLKSNFRFSIPSKITPQKRVKKNFLANPLFFKLEKSNDTTKSSVENYLTRVKTVVNSFKESSDVDEFCRTEGISKETFLSWKNSFLDISDNKTTSENKKIIVEALGNNVYDFFNQKTDLSANTLVLPVDKKLSSFSNLTNIRNVVLVEKMNNFRKINKYFEAINEQLNNGDYLYGSFETFTDRTKKKKIYSIPFLGKIYASYEFIYKRVIPKLPVLKCLYFEISKGKDRLLSKAESLGRLVSCGFEIVNVKEIDGIHYFISKKIQKPAYNMNPSYGPLFKMNRVGKNGKIIGVYKFRTMHPYSEYLQEYIVNNNGYSETGKPANDFRVVPWAKILRRYWIDEIPQLINVFKGEMKLVGVRPVSKTYFDNSVSKDIQELRITQKPGCIPPYVALNRQSSVNCVLEAEREYLEEKIKNPYFTDTKYFFKAIFNIVFKRKRSA